MSAEARAESVGKRNLYILAIVGGVISLAFGLFLPILPLYAKHLGADGLGVGILTSSFMLTRALVGPYAGKLSDMMGRKKIILFGTFLYGFLSVLYVVPSTWIGLAVIRAIQGIASGAVWPVSEALIIDSVRPDKRARAISIFIITSNIGWIGGPVLGGTLSQIGVSLFNMDIFDSYKIPFYFTAIFSFACVGLVAFGTEDVIHPQNNKNGNGKGVEIPEENKKMLNVLYINSFLVGLCMGLGSAIFVLYANDVFGLSAFVISVILTVGMGGGIAFAYPVARFADKRGRKKIIVGTGLLRSIMNLLMPMAPTPLVMASVMSVRSIGMQCADAPMRSLQADIIPKELRGKLVGTMQSFNNIGAIAGPIIGGLLYDFVENTSYWLYVVPFFIKGLPFFISGILGILGVILIWKYIDESKIRKM
ncbi:MAG: MFS transporter [Thermoplasmata archaeon]|nr:MFS transporter [Thermoplasmata archaeon]